MDLLHFVNAFHIEVSKLLDKVESLGEANGYMEWVVGRLGDYEVYFLWFPRTKKLVYVLKSGKVQKEAEVEVKNRLAAIAQVEKIVQELKR